MALVLRHTLPLPLLIVFLAAASHGVPSGSGGNNYISYRATEQPHRCGNVTIQYPFYFYNKTGFPDLVNNSSYCGYPGLGVRCEDGESAVLPLGNQKYNILNISYTDLTVSVVDQEVSVQDGNCPGVDHNVTLPQNSWLSYPNDTVDYLLFFLNCSVTTVTASPGPTSRVNCSFAGNSYVLPQRDVPPGDWWQACQRLVEAPVLRSAVPTYAVNDSRWRSGGYGSALRQGFQLTWDQKPLACDQCERSNGWCGYNQAGEFTGCFCSDGQVDAHNCSSVVPSDELFPSKTGGHHSDSRKYLLISTCCALLLCLLALFVTYKYGLPCIKSTDAQRIESFLQENGNLHPKRYTYAEVKRMTKSFSVNVGQGGFGAVYRGNFSDGRQVAVKMLKDSNSNGEEFMNEVASISRTSHVNVVMLLGFCLQGSKRALIYEYMPNGSLERYAFNSDNGDEHIQTWEKFFDIAIGIARGLEYLHRGCNTRIVHFDIKPHNILLDHNFCPKISDFGLAKLCINKESAISIAGARGTIGYIAPEVYSKQFGTISSKSDVYSYGMMVLEMVGARDTNANANSESSSQYFPRWIYEHLDDYCISASKINGETTELVRKMIVVGLWCIQVNPTHRPTMTRVVEMLEGSTSTLELPPNMFWS